MILGPAKSDPDLCRLHPHRCFHIVKGSIDARIQNICLYRDSGLQVVQCLSAKKFNLFVMPAGTYTNRCKKN